MNIENLRDLCRELPAVTEDIKWGHDLCFSVAGKMFCVAALDGPLTVSFKVRDDEFDELSNSPGMRPAPYVARYKWVLVEEVNRLSRKEWAHYVKQSYDLVRAKLPKKLAREHGLRFKMPPNKLIWHSSCREALARAAVFQTYARRRIYERSCS